MKQIALFAAMVMTSTMAMAQAVTQTVTLDGVKTDKAVAEITFSGNDAVLAFTDGTNQTIEAAKVNIALDYSTTGISAMNAEDKKKSSKTYNLNGQEVAESYKGVAIKDGKKAIRK